MPFDFKFSIFDSRTLEAQPKLQSSFALLPLDRRLNFFFVSSRCILFKLIEDETTSILSGKKAANELRPFPGDEYGTKKGSYGYTDAYGIYR